MGSAASPPAVPVPERWAAPGVHAAWLGHSTVLLKIDGFTILTDPVFSERAGLRVGPLTLGVKRLVAPPIGPAELPPIDLILLSHAHMDHLDLPSLRALENPRVRQLGDQLACLCGCGSSVTSCNMLHCHFSDPARQKLLAMVKAGMSDSAIFAAFVVP